MMKKYTLLLLIASLFSLKNTLAQQMGFGAKGGLTVGIQKSLYPLVSYHGDLFFESLSAWKDNKGTGKYSRIGVVAQLGYHRKGVSYTNGRYYAGQTSAVKVEDVFHNLSLGLLLKGSFQYGKFAPYFGVGFRGDATLDFSLLAQQNTNAVLPQVNRAIFGFWLGGGIEWESPKMPFGILLEINVSPDLTPQMLKTQRLIFNSSTGRYSAQILTPPEKTINIALEVAVGFKFIGRQGEKEPLAD